MKLAVIFICLITLGLSAPSHELWLAPSKFALAKGERISVRLREGDNFRGNTVDFQKFGIERIELHHLSNIKDLRSMIAGDSISFIPEEAGLHAIIMETKPEITAWDGGSFNEYLKDNGLNDIYNTRERTNSLDEKAREKRMRYAKALIRAGSGSDNTFSEKGIFPIEIIPSSDPYQYKVGEFVAFKAFFQGKPLFGAKVKVWNFYKKRYTEQNIYPEMDGTMEAHISNPGKYMLSVMQMVPSREPEADWQTYWCTLVFNVQ